MTRVPLSDMTPEERINARIDPHVKEWNKKRTKRESARRQLDRMQARYHLTHVWAVNFCSELDWECLRDDGLDSVEDVANVICLPQLFLTQEEALDAGEAAWKADHLDLVEEEGKLEALAMFNRLVRQDANGTRTLMDGEEFVALIGTRKLELPSPR